MKSLNRNKQELYYALYTHKEPIIDEYGNKTGEFSLVYSEPTPVWMNISAARGTAETEMFGISANYTKTLVTSDMSCPIQEDTILWIGISPEGGTPYNYSVVQVAKSLNSITYAIKEVEVS